MALKLSTALQNFLTQSGSLKNALMNGIIEIYSGTQPTDPNSAVAGTLLMTITDNSGAFTPEVLSSGSITITGSSGSITNVTVNGVSVLDSTVTYNTSAAQTASDLAAAINSTLSSPEYTASASGAVVTLKALPGTGAGPNTYVVAVTSTLTNTPADFAGGSAAVNGLKLQNSVSGVISKRSSQTWSGNGVANGTAGWFRFKGSISDAGGADSSNVYIRMDGSVGTSGANLNMTSTAIVTSAPESVSGFSITQPAA
jgi:hypothetical protein